jgi:hypothetical protein
MSSHERSDTLHARVQQFIRASLRGATSDGFDELACDIARFQADRIGVVKNAFDHAGVSLGRLASASDIPALPTDVFRLRRIAAHDAHDDERTFATSATTHELRGRHAFRTTASYRMGALAWAERMLWPDQARLGCVVLASNEARLADSSLGFMLARFAEVHGGASWHWDGERLDSDGVRRALDAAREADAPLLVAGTSFAFVHLCDALAAPSPLPKGSRVMQTGGFKGKSREVDAAALRRAIAEAFALDPGMVIAEYGMTELSSQLYQGTIARALGSLPRLASDTAYYPPPWLRVAAVDPTTLAPVPVGQEGIGRIVDLCNVDSSVAIQTGDRLIEKDDGSVELLGRLPGAIARGCSLALEQALTGHA